MPYCTPDFPGVGGIIKAAPEDFRVTEIPLYEPCGEGDHLYLDVERLGMETRHVVEAIAEAAGVSSRDVGFAGMKDKQAVSRQWFSIPCGEVEDEDSLVASLAGNSLTVHKRARHQNKLKRGHNLGNRFEIVIRDVEPDAARIASIAGRLQESGMPNFYGPQRFGSDGLNAQVGRAVLLGRRVRSRAMRTLMMNAWQSRLFNRWLTCRLSAGGLDHALMGDVARVEGSGGLFLIRDPAAESARLLDHEIQLTGPLFGAKMMPAEDAARLIEESVFEEEGVALDALKKARLPGSRRTARVLVPDLEWSLEESSLTLRFTLPKGSYATVLVREFTKTD